tara:strand:+ start:59451 stop:60614 length:1164 start_codon:yes stop_codon:yes gene_type:complete
MLHRPFFSRNDRFLQRFLSVITSSRFSSDPVFNLTVQVRKKTTIQLLLIAFGLTLAFILLTFGLKRLAPSLFLFLVLPIFLSGVALFLVALRCGQSIWKDSWFEFSSSGVEDHASYLRLGHIPIREIHSVKWIQLSRWRVLRVRMEDDASVFKDWDEPKGVFIDLYRFILGSRIFVPDFLIANSSEISNEWTKKFTNNVRRIKESMRGDGTSRFEGNFNVQGEAPLSLAQQFKFNIESSRRGSGQGREGESAGDLGASTAFAEVTNVTEQPIDFLGGFAELIRPLADSYDPQIHGRCVLSCKRDDSNMTSEKTKLFLPSGVEVEFVMRYLNDEDRTLFEILWKGQKVYAQEVQLEIGSLDPGALLVEAEGVWKQELVELFQELEKLA